MKLAPDRENDTGMKLGECGTILEFLWSESLERNNVFRISDFDIEKFLHAYIFPDFLGKIPARVIFYAIVPDNITI